MHQGLMRLCRGRGIFRRYAVSCVCVLGLYLLSSIIIKTDLVYHQYHPAVSNHPSVTPVVERVVEPYFRATVINNHALEHNSAPHTSNILPRRRINDRVLVVYDAASASIAKSIRILLQSHRIPHDVYLHHNTSVLSLSEEGEGESVGKYSLLIFADASFLHGKWPSTFVENYLHYLRSFEVTVIHFASPHNLGHFTETNQFSIFNISTNDVTGIKLNASRSFYYLKNAEWFTDVVRNDSWVGFVPAESAHTAGGLEVISTIRYRQVGVEHELTTPLSLITTRRGVREVLIGCPVRFWMTKLLLLEWIREYTSFPRLGRKRWVMIDIDDIFVAPKGVKMTTEDVRALLKSQQTLREYVPGLTFNLGFCGYYYDKGLDSEITGSRYLVEKRDNFWWFGHIYNHYQPHMVNEEELRKYISQNLDFAKEHSIQSLENSYSVSPHHSGVYPVHQPLYRAWAELLNVTMTTTEEYHHLYPSHMRRGFIYQGIMVVPRQTCRLFTHNFLFEDFVVKNKENVGVANRGEAGLRGVAEGGEVFNAILYNPVSIFMTHVTNYARDRLAPFLFENLFKFITRWTKLELLTERPLTLGKIYFSLFPEDKTPIWTSPCNDKRHLDIWPEGKNCTRLPEAVILGPQKTGSTALHFFMNTHPNLSASFQSKEKYEEVQFFSDEGRYLRGIDWYMDQFPYPGVAEKQVNFEKSATYFTHAKSPERLYSLLPKAKLIVILGDPVKRAYSWYQHMRAHDDPMALKYSFLEVLQGPALNHSTTTAEHTGLTQLRQHCLEPGRYHKYISQWLKLFPASRMLFVDGTMIKEQPAHVLYAVQKFLKLSVVDYGKTLSYSHRKGHYCLLVEGKQKCLGPSKGRQYPPLRDAELSYLLDYYSQEDAKLITLLRDLKRPIPIWLADR